MWLLLLRLFMASNLYFLKTYMDITSCININLSSCVLCTWRVKSSADACGMVLYICPSISLSWDTMGAKSCRRVFTDFSKMAHTAWERAELNLSCIRMEMIHRKLNKWLWHNLEMMQNKEFVMNLTSTTCESFSHLLRTVCISAKTCWSTTTT